MPVRHRLLVVWRVVLFLVGFVGRGWIVLGLHFMEGLGWVMVKAVVVVEVMVALPPKYSTLILYFLAFSLRLILVILMDLLESM